ncbi:uncharacterized protein LOC144439742 [Glandiceps talaboti]
MRSFFPDVRVLALTATASRTLQLQIQNFLVINDYKIIHVCPDKKNIRYGILKINSDIPSTLYWMMDKLHDERGLFPRTIEYCSSIDVTASLYHYFEEEFPESAKYIEMYHSETDSRVQESHLHEIRKESKSELRIIFCTTALGMGVDVKGTHHVIHYGVSFDLESYIQFKNPAESEGMETHFMQYCSTVVECYVTFAPNLNLRMTF